jgi:group I intron endonuclease
MSYSDTYGQVFNVYILTNSFNGKQYIGITKNLKKRWASHRNANGKNPALHAAIVKYGVDAFVFTHYADAFDEDSAKNIEILLIKQHNTLAPNGYNLTSGGDGTLQPSDQLRKQLSDSHKGKKQTEETKKRRSESLKKAYAEGRRSIAKGKTWKMNEKGKEKIRLSKLGSNNPAYGKKQSPELIAKRFAAIAINAAKKRSVQHEL